MGVWLCFPYKHTCIHSNISYSSYYFAPSNNVFSHAFFFFSSVYHFLEVRMARQGNFKQIAMDLAIDDFTEQCVNILHKIQNYILNFFLFLIFLHHLSHASDGQMGFEAIILGYSECSF